MRSALACALTALALVAAGCDDEDVSAPSGGGEGRVDLVTWAGYVEDGSSDPAVDWVTPFERATGCRVTARVANTPDELVAMMRSGAYDGGLGSGDVTGRLVASHDLAPVDATRIPDAADLFAAPAATVDGRTYAVPQAWGANLLMWRTDLVRPAPTSWSVVFDPRSRYRGKVAPYDNPIAIADGALYLGATKPSLGIEDPYELDDRQFAAVVGVLRQQRELISNYWWDFVREQAAFAAGDAVVGTTWQLVADELRADRVPVATTLPTEGATGWVDGWMVSSTARHPVCMERWIDWMLSPAVSAQVAEWYGAAPANPKACTRTDDPGHCARYHAEDDAYRARIAFWKLPRKECGDGRGAVCKGYEDWVDAWEEITD